MTDGAEPGGQFLRRVAPSMEQREAATAATARRLTVRELRNASWCWERALTFNVVRLKTFRFFVILLEYLEI